MPTITYILIISPPCSKVLKGPFYIERNAEAPPQCGIQDTSQSESHTLPAHLSRSLRVPSAVTVRDPLFLVCRFAFVHTTLPSLSLFFLSFLPIFIHASKTMHSPKKSPSQGNLPDISFLFEEYISVLSWQWNCYYHIILKLLLKRLCLLSYIISLCGKMVFLASGP